MGEAQGPGELGREIRKLFHKHCYITPDTGALKLVVLTSLFRLTITSQNELLVYKAKHGNCHVPTKYKDNTALGRWVSTQRADYKKYQEGMSKTSMNEEKIRRLEGIGFAWFMAL